MERHQAHSTGAVSHREGMGSQPGVEPASAARAPVAAASPVATSKKPAMQQSSLTEYSEHISNLAGELKKLEELISCDGKPAGAAAAGGAPAGGPGPLSPAHPAAGTHAAAAGTMLPLLP